MSMNELDRYGRPRRPNRRRVFDVGRLFAYCGLGIWSLFVLFPLYWVLVSSLKLPVDVFALPPTWIFTPTLVNYEEVLGIVSSAQVGSGSFLIYFLNSFIVSGGSTLVALIVGCPAGYALARARFRGRRTILMGVLLTRLVPSIVLIIPIYILWDSVHMLDTYQGLILAYVTIALPFVVWMTRGFFLSVPRELEESALIDGCSRLQVMTRVAIPLIAPGLAATTIFTALVGWNEFLIAVVLGGRQVQLAAPAILGFDARLSTQWGPLYAASVLMLIPVVVLAVVMQRHIASGLTAGAVKG